jgi:isopenicillin N synthase-like dioxygenase
MPVATMSTHSDDAFPVIDVSDLSSSSVLDAVDRACREWGFFQVVGHGVARELSDALRSEMRGFFALSSDAKRGVERTVENPWGYYDRELTKNVRDWKEIFDCGQQGDPLGRTPWPAERPRLRAVLRAYMAACEAVAFRLLGAISANLGMPPGHLARDFHPNHTSFLRLNRYPVCAEPARPSGVRTPARGYLGVNHHTDAGALTLLLQDDEAGLEVFHGRCWHLVEPLEGALVVNIGDIVQVWSNDRYRAALHRVRASATRDRFSAPFFFNPAYEACYAPLPSTLAAGARALYRPIRWGEFRSARSAGDYCDRGEEVQIHHYRIGEET